MTRGLNLVAVLFGAVFAVQLDPVRPDPLTPRPIASRDSVFLEDLTWMEIRDAMRAGKDTVIVATGGVEQNGPYLVTGKHNVVLRATTEAIARKLTNALIAPIVPFVPEGDIDPPTLHMKYPGTISVTDETFERLLIDICSSLRTHGFKNIVLIGDSGGNQAGMKSVADLLNTKWDDDKAKVFFIPEYYRFEGLAEWLEKQGIREKSEGIHDDFAITATMMVVDPVSVRMQERIAADKFRINGIELAPVKATMELGKKIIELRAEITIKAFYKAHSNSRSGKP